MLLEHSFEVELIATLAAGDADPNRLTGTKLAFFLATITMLREHKDDKGFREGLSIYWRAAERLGLVTRDDRGLFTFGDDDQAPLAVEASVYESSAAETDDENGHHIIANEAVLLTPDSSSTLSAQAEDAEGRSTVADKAKLSVPSAPSLEYIKAEIAAKRAMYKKPFEYRMGSGRQIGEFHYSELQHAEVLSAQDVKIFRAVREYAIADGDPVVADYFPEKKLTEILTEVKRHANN